MTPKKYKWPKGCLTEDEWRELVTIEYVLTWRYTDNEKLDDLRYRYLSDKRWNSLYPTELKSMQ